MEEKMNQKDYLISKLKTVLRGEARMIIDNMSSASPLEKKERMNAIEDMAKYIENYDKNMEIIKKQEQINYLHEDDLR